MWRLRLIGKKQLVVFQLFIVLLFCHLFDCSACLCGHYIVTGPAMHMPVSDAAEDINISYLPDVVTTFIALS